MHHRSGPRKWFAVNHWDVVPDLMTMAKGLTSAYVPMGAVGMRQPIADYFRDKVFQGGLTYNSHPLACAAALDLERAGNLRIFLMGLAIAARPWQCFSSSVIVTLLAACSSGSRSQTTDCGLSRRRFE